MTYQRTSAGPITEHPANTLVHYDPAHNQFVIDAVGLTRLFFDTAPEDPNYPAYHSPADGPHREAWTKKVLMTVHVAVYLHTFEAPPQDPKTAEVKHA